MLAAKNYNFHLNKSDIRINNKYYNFNTEAT